MRYEDDAPARLDAAVRKTSQSSRASAVVGKDRLILFDTTLRDGEQSPGATLNLKEKVEIARVLSRFGVDICEAGFPIASPGDFEAVKTIATEIGPLMTGREATGQPMRICGLSRASEKDIQRCFDAVKHAPLHRIHTFLATSDIHLKHKLNISREECIERAAKAVKFASSLSEDVEFSTEDAMRSDPKFLVEVLKEVIAAGATTLNIPDTVGFTTPIEYQQVFEYLIANTPGADKVVWSTHCHNDLGLATANSLAGIAGGARQVEVTVNGIGERAGNTAIEEIIMAVRTRPQQFNVYTSVDATQITRASRMVTSFTGMAVQPNKAIVGENAFAHEAGIHQDGVLKHAETYEIMTPESVGLSTNSLVLGKHSGKHAYKARLEELGYTDLSPQQIDEFVDKFKRLADEKKVVTDADMEAIVADEIYQPEHVWELRSIHVTAGNLVKATATVSLVHIDGHEVTEAAVGAGPVDAIFTSIQQVVRVPNRLVQYKINAVTEGVDAIGEVVTKLEFVEDYESPEKSRRLQRTDSGIDAGEFKNPQTGSVTNRNFTGHGADTDILVASAKSYLSALNRMISHKKQISMQQTPPLE
ncbi:2-isopropylmalate synthase [Hondaea fermentalgiana]|uniref:2-isopropylmalate synthase n=1 Tax=Hondaea fermentalgiana TaxID=2315210 RepID=A0A2R5GZD9_9STRA|nr:2-isopropylmalate synthase [Hondaea fermentalgiana]|eukprot:GBG33841.1 2-isopropylmalate synthase [Hondaea fermentalgiana]